jgi:hypothetical protein
MLRWALYGLVILWYCNVCLLVITRIDIPDGPLPSYCYPIFPPTIVHPSPFEDDCWGIENDDCWLQLVEI